MDADNNPFWTFSLSLYRKPDVPPACLALQENYGADVNLLLYCLWIAGELDPASAADQLTQAMAVVEKWHGTVVRPLRHIRQAMKGGIAPVGVDLSDPLREEIKSIELAAERVEQTVLWAQTTACTGARTTDYLALETASNLLARYFERLGRAIDPSDECHVETLLRTAFPDVQRYA